MGLLASGLNCKYGYSRYIVEWLVTRQAETEVSSPVLTLLKSYLDKRKLFGVGNILPWCAWMRRFEQGKGKRNNKVTVKLQKTVKSVYS